MNEFCPQCGERYRPGKRHASTLSGCKEVEAMETVTHNGRRYLVERFDRPSAVVGVYFILREVGNASSRSWGLLKVTHDAGKFFATDLNDFERPTPFDGHRFIDRDGELRICD